MSLEGGGRKSQRRLLRKMEEDGAHFRIVAPGDVHALVPQLKAVSDDWLTRKKVREKGFSLGFFSEAYLAETSVAVVETNGCVVAFANLLESGDQSELTVDLMRYAEGAPPSVMEFLLLRTMLHGRDLDYEWFNLGMAPLAGLESRRLAPLWNRFGAALFRWGENFYNFEGLREFKQKFDPVWEPRYLASPGGLALPRVLANVSTLISGGVRGVITR
jgi:phosphatidylglycerol lysyltransferase